MARYIILQLARVLVVNAVQCLCSTAGEALSGHQLFCCAQFMAFFFVHLRRHITAIETTNFWPHCGYHVFSRVANNLSAASCNACWQHFGRKWETAQQVAPWLLSLNTITICLDKGASRISNPQTKFLAVLHNLLSSGTFLQCPYMQIR